MPFLPRIARGVMMLIGIGRQTADTDETPATPTVQATLAMGEIHSDMPLMQHAGFACRPLADSDHVIVFIGGNRQRGVSIASNDQNSRPRDLQPGETCIYSPATGSRIWLKEDGSIAIVPANGKTALTGDLTATGTITGNKVVAQGIKLSTHPHGGVTPGSGKSGAPEAS
ncbi:phage baseplate assembly protein domain-containing protein [Komagataeibacter sp. NFXK3]